MINASARTLTSFWLAALPGFIIERANQANGGFANGGEFLEKVGQFAARKVAALDVGILFKAGKGSLIPTGKAKYPVGEDAFRVSDVAKNFLDGPFSRGVAKVRLLL